ncbi:2,3-dehydroadipyl-CoA hydratase [Paraburkholderia sp. Ac-20342]|uniref:enoyl-CoA hydratase-related protein n=1 Tax=Paraburkholderia sp. Ac-20342 TaxID=2703889 RepID=UPI001981FF3A|nr:2,3-dehydroadipyl-CoA hydratase [Paraburkholderia sp. Ac-20342]
MDYGNPEDAQCVTCERVGDHVLVMRIDRVAKRNALSNPMVIEMGRVLREATDDRTVRCVVITGGEEVFSAGADMKNMLQYGVIDVVSDPRRIEAWNAIATFAKPMIAAVNGVAVGAGNELVLCCDLIVAGSNAQFGQPEVRNGGLAGDGGTQRLPRKLGPQLATYMLLSGEMIDAQTALKAGYVLEVCEPARTLDRAIEIANVIAERAPLSVQFTKACINEAVGANASNGLAYERVAMFRNHRSRDRQEGLNAFKEKRRPQYTGE